MTEKQKQEIKQALNPTHFLDLRDPEGKPDNNKIGVWYVITAIIVAQFVGKAFSPVVAVILITAAYGARYWSMFLRQQKWKFSVGDQTARIDERREVLGRRDADLGYEPS